MKALTFVGVGDYKTTRYVHGEAVVESNLFPVAVYEFFQPDRMIVFVTRESRERYWDELCRKLAGKIQPEAVEIPWGKTPDELWTIFDRVVESVDEGEEVLFDITHGFRSLPFVSFTQTAHADSATNGETGRQDRRRGHQ